MEIEIISVSSFRFICLPICYGSTVIINIFIYFYNAKTNFRRQNLTSTDVRFRRLKSVSALQELRYTWTSHQLNGKMGVFIDLDGIPHLPLLSDPYY